jgi:hypothetical protein
MRNLPSKVMIFGKPVKIKYSEDVSVNGHPVFGLFEPDKWAITIDSKQSREQIIDTIIHEMGHALMSRLYLVSIIPAEIIEQIVENYAVMLRENMNLKFK